MNEFLNCIECKFVGVFQSRPIIRLTEPLLFHHDIFGLIVVPTGMDCDLASVPRLPVVFYLWGDRAHRAAVLHDYLYRKDCPGEPSREEADKLFYDAIVASNDSSFIATSMYTGVKLFGGNAFRKMQIAERFPRKCYYFVDETKRQNL